METKNQILKDLGFSDELIAKLNLSGKFVYHKQQTDFEVISVETEDFAELIIDKIDSPFINEHII